MSFTPPHGLPQPGRYEYHCGGSFRGLADLTVADDDEAVDADAFEGTQDAFEVSVAPRCAGLCAQFALRPTCRARRRARFDRLTFAAAAAFPRPSPRTLRLPHAAC